MRSDKISTQGDSAVKALGELDLLLRQPASAEDEIMIYFLQLTFCAEKSLIEINKTTL